ncbi:MAG: hypothetical protein M3356_06635 [Actinomycetota bacterium]|nr:hypothetical protein [Actinomycetota bacterium]
MTKPRDLVAALLGVRVARGLYGRWRQLSATDRDRMGPMADDVRERALDLRGAADLQAAERKLQQANEKLAQAMVESAAANPDVSEAEVLGLREELSRELERMAEGDITASRGPAGRAPAGEVKSGPRG